MRYTLTLAIAFISLHGSAQIPTNGLIGWYPYTGSANDQSGYSIDATVNGATLTTDRFGNANSAYLFDGINDNIWTPYPSATFGDLSQYDSLSISIWFDKYSNNPVNTDLFDLRDMLTNDALGLTLQYDTLAAGMFHYTGGSGGTGWNLKTLFNMYNDWNHVIITYDHLNTITRLYLNGALVNSFNLPYDAWGTNNRLTVGSRFDWMGNQCCFFDGKIDDVRLYSVVLNQAEVTALYNEGLCFETVFDTVTTNINVYDTLTTTLTVFDTITSTVTVYDTSYVTITDTNYISVTDTLLIDVLTGLSAPNDVNTISVYPNPANTNITIDNGTYPLLGGFSLNIANSVGQVVFQSPINQQQFDIDLSTWSGAGIYFLNVVNIAGNTVLTRTIVLQ